MKETMDMCEQLSCCTYPPSQKIVKMITNISMSTDSI